MKKLKNDEITNYLKLITFLQQAPIINSCTQKELNEGSESCLFTKLDLVHPPQYF